MPRPINCIVAVCPNMGIGHNGNLPWHPKRLSNEFKYFQKMTMTPTLEGQQNAVIMGRKTWFSIPERNRPLKNRINIVLSRELKNPPEGAHYLASDFSSALRLLDGAPLADQVDQVWVIGGSSVYKCVVSPGKSYFMVMDGSLGIDKREAMEAPGWCRLFVTQILQDFECDTFLPEINLNKYRLLPEFPGVPLEVQEENGIRYKFEVYESIQN